VYTNSPLRTAWLDCVYKPTFAAHYSCQIEQFEYRALNIISFCSSHWNFSGQLPCLIHHSRPRSQALYQDIESRLHFLCTIRQQLQWMLNLPHGRTSLTMSAKSIQSPVQYSRISQIAVVCLISHCVFVVLAKFDWSRWKNCLVKHSDCSRPESSSSILV
jgi:hypothetical protein